MTLLRCGAQSARVRPRVRGFVASTGGAIAVAVALGGVFAALAACATHPKKTVVPSTSGRKLPALTSAPAPPLVAVQSPDGSDRPRRRANPHPPPRQRRPTRRPSSRRAAREPVSRRRSQPLARPRSSPSPTTRRSARPARRSSDQLERLDLTCSRFRSDSELQRANARAGATLAISPLLAELVEAALEAAETTGGRVDPTLGGPLRAAGYDRTFALVRERDTWSFAERPVPRRAMASRRARHAAG